MWASLTQVATPSLVLYGESTYPFVPQSVQRWAQVNRQVTATQVPGGHCFMQEDPAACSERVEAFLLG
ncbi:Alpha/beta hydrolase family protein [compost metagenome]